MKSLYDVIVIGAGPSGITAAIQAGRLGSRTLLVEKNGIAGGTIVSGGIPTLGSFYAYDKQIISGIGFEVCTRAQREIGRGIPRPSTVNARDGGTSHVIMNPAVFAAVADEMLLEAGVDILFHSMPASMNRKHNEWQLQICTKTGLRDIRTKIIIDCTGDANVVNLAGLETKRNSDLQAATLVVKVGGYEVEKLNYKSIQQAFDNEVAAGNMKKTDPGWEQGNFSFFLKNYGGNRIHLPNISARSSEEKTLAEIEGRKAMLRIMRFCRKQAGLENFTIESCATECGIRETVTIKGKKYISVKDYESGYLWEDSICYSFYMIAIHKDDKIISRDIKPGIYPTIPLGAMLPADSEGIIVAGRCISGDQEAIAACRIQASCMAMGQAAGAAAALTVKGNTDFESLPIEQLCTVLRQYQAIVPPDIKNYK